jgi:hypothetical protein
MKKLFLILILFLFSTAYAGEKEELQCRQELLKERMLRLQLQFQLLQDEYERAIIELKRIEKKIKKLKDKANDHGNTK